MKRIILSFFLAGLVSLSFGQSVKKAASYLESKNLDKAKTEIDAVLSKNPEDMDAIYLKSKIYSQIAGNEQFQNLVTGDAYAEALAAFKSAVADSGNVKLKLKIIQDNYQPVFDIYAGYYDLGAKAFNAAATSGDKNKFTEAMNFFIKADNVGHYLYENKWAVIGEVDTTLVLNIGKAAINAENDDVALTYFSKLADAKIAGSANSSDLNSFKIPYQWLALHYKNAKDYDKMLKYANLGRELFPNDDYLDFLLIDYYRKYKQETAMFDLYKELISKNPDSISYHFDYANDIFGYLYNSDEGTVINNRKELIQILNDELKTARSINENDINSNWLTAQYYYNMGIETRDEANKIKGTKPEDVKKKSELNTAATNYFKEAIPYANKPILHLEASHKKSQRSSYKSIVNLMQNIYQSLGDKVNLKVYQDKYDNAEKIFVD